MSKLEKLIIKFCMNHHKMKNSVDKKKKGGIIIMYSCPVSYFLNLRKDSIIL